MKKNEKNKTRNEKNEAELFVNGVMSDDNVKAGEKLEAMLKKKVAKRINSVLNCG